MKQFALLLSIAIVVIGCALKENIDPPPGTKENPKFDTRVLYSGNHCTIAKDALGSDDHYANLQVTVDSMSYKDSFKNPDGSYYYYFVVVETSEGMRRYPDRDLIDCK